MDDVKIISSEDDIKVLADVNRFAIMDILATYEALSTNEIAEKTGLTYSKVSYNLKKLEEAGFIKIVDTRVKFGILEKYYSLAAKEFKIVPVKEANGHYSNLLDEIILKSITKEYLKSNQFKDEDDMKDKRNNIYLGNVYLTDEEYAQVRDKINEYFNELLGPYRQRTSEEQKPYTISNIFFIRG
ncbi:MAG TPA: helix-turn-helix domain-containing protein [Tissierellia bacterium]|nr:helix-turn-helix domain-containing protein [Tissierellia bacterium]